jgi:DNA-binding MarR family transcriptional regulator
VSNTKEMTLRLLEHTAGLPANQRLILMLYAAHPTDRAGTVSKTAAELADVLGMSPTVFSRTRRQIVESGWLEESERLGHIRYYRLSPKATGEEVVVPLRRAT